MSLRRAIATFIPLILFNIATLNVNAASDDGSVTFPVLTADDLNGTPVTLPGDLPGDPTLVFVAFKRSQQANVNAWVDALHLNDRPDIAWVELPTMNRVFKIMKGYIDNGMQSGITDRVSRARTISIYGQSSLMTPLGITTRDQIVVMVVRPSGDVLAMVSGDPTTESIDILAETLGVSFATP